MLYTDRVELGRRFRSVKGAETNSLLHLPRTTPVDSSVYIIFSYRLSLSSSVLSRCADDAHASASEEETGSFGGFFRLQDLHRLHFQR